MSPTTSIDNSHTSSPESVVDDRKSELEVMREPIDASGDSLLSVPLDQPSVGGNLHALDDGIDLMSAFCAFRFLTVEHDSVLHLVVQTAPFGVGKGHDDVVLLILEILTCASKGTSSTRARDECIDDTVCLSPNLGSRAIEMGVIITAILLRMVRR